MGNRPPVCNGRSVRICLTAWLLMVAAAAPWSAPGPRLSIQGDRFAVDGAPKFLTFITYFGALGAQDLDADLDFVRESGFDGVRIWPNSPDGPALMRSDGSLDGATLQRLTTVLDRAYESHLLVDITFTAEHVDGLDAVRFQNAIVATTRALSRYDHILFDVQNERDVYGPLKRPLPPAEAAAIVAAVKRVQPTRIVTASTSPGTSPATAAALASQTGLDVTAYHDARGTDWYTPGSLQAIVNALRSNGRPAYLQEPNRFPFSSTDRAEYFRLARENSQRAGASAWCFHTDRGFNLRAVRLSDALRSRQEPEWAFVTWLGSQRARGARLLESPR